jgi:hypothetical protein
MASASSRRTLDTDYITLRKVFAKLSDNSQVPADAVLTSVGDGRVYWASPSTLGGLPTFSEIQFDTTRYIGTNNIHILRISASNGIGVSTTVSSTTSSLQLIGQNFSQIDVSGVSSLNAFSNFLLNNSLHVANTGFLSTATTPSQMLVSLTSLRTAPALSTNIISYQALKVISSLAAPEDTSPFRGNTIWSKTDTNIFPVLAGYQDFVFQTNFIPPVVGIELSSFSAKEFLGLSTAAATSFVSTLSTISSLYTQKNIFSTAMISLSTTEWKNYSTNVSTMIELSNYTQTTYNQKFGDTLSRATILQLNDQFGILNTGVSTISSFKTPLYIMLSTNQGFVDSYSTPQTLSTSTFLDFAAGSIFNFTVNGMLVVSTQLSTLSTNIGSNIQTFSNGIQLQIPTYLISTASTFTNLGNLDYISSPSLQSSVRTLGSFDYISSPSLVSSFSTFVSGYPSSFQMNVISTTQGLIDRQLIISSLTLQSSIVSTTLGLGQEAAYTYISTRGLAKTTTSTTQGIYEYAGSIGYVSTLSLANSLQSTVNGLSNSLYVTTSQSVSSIQSTVNGVSFISTATMQAEYDANSNYLFINDLISTSDFFLNYKRQFTSTITIPSSFSDQQATMVPVFGGQQYGLNTGSNFYFSSLQIPSLTGFDRYLQNARFVLFEYTPFIQFSGYDPFTPTVNGLYNPAISTGLQINNSFLPETLFREIVFAPFSSGGYSGGGGNLYSKKIILQVNRDLFLSSISEGFGIVHVFENLTNSNTAGFRFESDVNLYTSRSNSLFISIYN